MTSLDWILLAQEMMDDDFNSEDEVGDIRPPQKNHLRLSSITAMKASMSCPPYCVDPTVLSCLLVRYGCLDTFLADGRCMAIYKRG
jgi:hypothetical protein